MVAYTQNEMFSISDFTKQISKIINNIKEKSFEKIAILRNNKLEAVVISPEEYERLKQIEKLVEHTELYKEIQKRENTKLDDYIEFDDLAKKFDIDLKKI